MLLVIGTWFSLLICQSRKEEFTASIIAFIKASGFAACVLLSGVDMSNRTDTQMMWVPGRLVGSQLVYAFLQDSYVLSTS